MGLNMACSNLQGSIKFCYRKDWISTTCCLRSPWCIHNRRYSIYHDFKVPPCYPFKTALDYATNLSNSSYTKNTGVVSSEWNKHIFESVTLPRPSEDFCRYLCNTSKSYCEIAVLDANRCLMGSLNYTAGNPTLLDSTWNVDIQAGTLFRSNNFLHSMLSQVWLYFQIYSCLIIVLRILDGYSIFLGLIWCMPRPKFGNQGGGAGYLK